MAFSWRQPAIVQHTQRLLYSFQHWTGRPLLELTRSPLEQSQHLYDADFVVVSHGTEPDPIFNYGNGKALELWQVSWDELIQTPSRKTAEPIAQAERSQMLAEAANKGFISHYSGIRISSQGQRFRIDDGIIWDVVDKSGRRYGQAAVFLKIRIPLGFRDRVSLRNPVPERYCGTDLGHHSGQYLPICSATGRPKSTRHVNKLAQSFGNPAPQPSSSANSFDCSLCAANFCRRGFSGLSFLA